MCPELGRPGPPTSSGSSSAPTTLAQVVEEAAARHRDRPAVQLGARVVTYAELTDLAARWAHAIQERAPGARRVGVLGSRSLESYAGALAASWAGAGFVPLNPRLTADRLTRVARLAQLHAIIAEPAWAGVLDTLRPQLAPDLVVLGPADAAAPTHTATNTGTKAASAAPGDLAYLLFTSGTTGDPKGVGVTHANVLAYLANARARFDFAPTDRFSQMFEQSFDVSIFDLFVAWSSGACVVSIPAEQLIAPATYIEEEALTVYSSVPSVLSLMRRRRALRPGRFPAMRYAMFAGEALSVESAEAFMAAAPQAVVENLYGPTECTVVCTGYRLDGREGARGLGSIPIGTPFAGVEARVTHPDGTVVAPGEAGELWVGGSHTVPGYWQAPALTSEKFVRAPGTAADATVYYRTGDLVRALPSGDLQFLGRVDEQLKVLGRRVEPGEIESAARAVPGVLDAVAVGWPLEDGHPVAITLFISCGGEATAVSEDAVTAALAARLEPVLVPRRVVTTGAFPLNANGKVDRKALLASLAPAVVGS